MKSVRTVSPRYGALLGPNPSSVRTVTPESFRTDRCSYFLEGDMKNKVVGGVVMANLCLRGELRRCRCSWGK